MLAKTKEAESSAIRAEQERKHAEEEKAKAATYATETAQLSAAMDAAGPERVAELRIEFIQHLKNTNRTAHDLCKGMKFNSVGFEILFRGFLREKLIENIQEAAA